MFTSDISQDQQDLQACIAMMQGGSKTFFAASRLLPLRVRGPAIALYAFCRVADDLVDLAGPHDDPLPELRRRLDAIYAGTPENHVEDQALCWVVQQTQLPRHWLDALVEGFAWDADGKTFESLEDVHAYATRVAGSVGAMMCWMMGPRDEATLLRACELGMAMQLTNIARDVGEDARMGRLYLPREWLREAGVEPALWLQAPQCTPAVKSVVARLLEEADRLYRQAHHGIASLPPDCRAAICAASLIYAEIGHQLRRQGLDSVQVRTVVSGPRKLVLLITAWTQAGWIRTATLPPDFVGAAHDMVRPGLAPATPNTVLSEGSARGYFPNRSMTQRVAWVLELLERREKIKREKETVFSRSSTTRAVEPVRQ